MSFPAVGDFYNPNSFGFPWSKQGPGFVVSPQAPTEYPVVPQGFPQQPFSHTGLYSLLCNHWTNTVEMYEEFNPSTGKQAAVLCCPVCGMVQLIVEPISDWQNNFFGLYPLGLGDHTFTDPATNPNVP